MWLQWKDKAGVGGAWSAVAGLYARSLLDSGFDRGGGFGEET